MQHFTVNTSWKKKRYNLEKVTSWGNVNNGRMASDLLEHEVLEKINNIQTANLNCIDYLKVGCILSLLLNCCLKFMNFWFKLIKVQSYPSKQRKGMLETEVNLTVLGNISSPDWKHCLQSTQGNLKTR